MRRIADERSYVVERLPSARWWCRGRDLAPSAPNALLPDDLISDTPKLAICDA
jgi:hypothetical protein